MKNSNPKIKFETRVITICMMLFLLTVLMGVLSGCNKYKVLSYLRVNLYHLHNAKTKNSEIILTTDTLILGKEYKLKDINIIDSPYYKPKNK